MPLFVLISYVKNGRGVKTYGVKHNIFSNTMKSALIFLTIFVFSFHCAIADLEFYPDYQKPEILKWENEKNAEEFELERFTNYLQEQQRRLELERQMQEQREPDFTYSIPKVNMGNAEFAVAPPDPRFYQQTPTDDEEFLTNDFDIEEQEQEQEQERQQEQEQQRQHQHHQLDQIRIPPPNPKYLTPQMQLQLQYQEYQQKLKQQQEAEQQQLLQQELMQRQENEYQNEDEPEETSSVPQEKQVVDGPEKTVIHSEHHHGKSNKPVVLKTRTEANWALGGLSKTHPSSTYNNEWRKQDLNNIVTGYHSDQAVDIKPVSSSLQDDTAGVYIIAVVAGISAAATVGLIAFAIGWYNLQKNVKNASDVEYPAYGVTGPNKDVSPTGDRRLAQSAQMYHYQHQKQQIIAMESRAAATVRHGSMSEAESDEENEEGDYTVYECPGLAPTGEMEVKNPLFQDDPTPASQPSNNKNEENSLPDQK